MIKSGFGAIVNIRMGESVCEQFVKNTINIHHLYMGVGLFLDTEHGYKYTGNKLISLQ